MTVYGLKGKHTGDLLTYQGRPVVHDSREEMEWLMPGATVVAVTERDLRRRSPLPPITLREHPSLLGKVRWPLRKSDFVDSRVGYGRPSGRMRIYSSARVNSPT